MSNFDHLMMQKALDAALTAERQNDVPVGAVLTLNKKIMNITHNIGRFHAEFLLLKDCEIYNKCHIYVTLEPCALCASLILHTRIKKLFFAAYDPKMGCVEHNARIFNHSHHKTEWMGGIYEEQSKQLLKRFFQNKR